MGDNELERVAQVIRPWLSQTMQDPDDWAETRARDIAADVIAHAMTPAPQVVEDVWCRNETCRYRHWTSGSMPTHKIGHDCPPQEHPTSDAPCPTCAFPRRETVGLVCQTCGRDYGATSEVLADVGAHAGQLGVAAENTAEFTCAVAKFSALESVLAEVRVAQAAECPGPHGDHQFRLRVNAILDPEAER